MPTISAELATIGLIFGLMVVPRVLQRFRIPAPLTSFGLGMVAVVMLLFHEDSASSRRVALTLAPTLIFTLVLATILRERFGLPTDWYGALLVNAALSTLLPSLTRTFSLDASDVGAALARRTAASTTARSA